MTQIYSDAEIARGYAIDLKRVVLAYAAETIIVAASLVGAWLFAQQYGRHDPNTIVMMMLAPVAYAIVEFCRVPLAISIRTQTSFVLRGIAVLGVLGAGCVTVKSMSQLGEIMFRPRLADVMHARVRLNDAKSLSDAVQQHIRAIDTVVEQRRGELRNAEQQVTTATEKLGNLPEQKCMPISGVNQTGQAWKSMRCSADQRIAPLVQAVANATKERDTATKRLTEARSERGAQDSKPSDAAVRAEEYAYREAVLNSQLHSFAAMVFGKEPTEVTDSEVHQFLRIFVFVPAIGSAFAATLIGLMAVHRIKIEPAGVELAEAGGQYLLAPFAETILREAAVAASKSAQDSIVAAHESARIRAVQSQAA